MGTFVTIEAPSYKTIQKGFNLIREIENSLSTFKKDSLVYKLNRAKSVQPDKYLYDIVFKSLQIYKESNGYFDIAIGKLTKDIYRFGDNERLPKKLPHISTLPQISISKEQISIAKGIKLDFGGIAKGYAVDIVTKTYKKEKISKALIALSGDIRCIGKCRVAVDSPFDEGKEIASIYSNKKEFAISTSGIYRRYIKSQANNHIFNPYTKKAQTKIVSLTLFGEYPNYYLDAMATAIVAMGYDKALRFLKRKKLNFILITSDKKLYINRGDYKVALMEDGLLIEPF